MNTALGYYFVACIDVLGQSGRLLELNEVPSTSNEESEALKVLKDTAGHIVKLRKSFLDYYNEFSKQAPIESKYRAESVITSFSDTIVIAIPLGPVSEDYPLPAIASIYSALCGVGGIYLASLADKRPFRCGVDIGIGVELPTDIREVYGEVLVKASRLEKSICRYPRIVVGDSFHQYISCIQNYPSKTETAGIAINLAKFCKSLIANDHDSQKILDVLGETFHSLQACSQKHLVKKAYEFVVQSHNGFTKQGNSKLASRYEELRTYFESKLILWDIQPFQK